MNQHNIMTKTSSTRNIIIIIVFTVVSAALSLVKIPSPAGSIALDSAPGFFVAAFFSPILGAIVGGLGHLASAATGGFPFGLLHLYVSFEMFLWCLIFGFIIKKYDSKFSLYFAASIALIANGLIGPLVLTITPVVNLPLSMAKALIPFLLLAAAANIFLASIAFVLISKLNIQGL